MQRLAAFFCCLRRGIFWRERREREAAAQVRTHRFQARAQLQFPFSLCDADVRSFRILMRELL